MWDRFLRACRREPVDATPVFLPDKKEEFLVFSDQPGNKYLTTEVPAELIEAEFIVSVKKDSEKPGPATTAYRLLRS